MSRAAVQRCRPVRAAVAHGPSRRRHADSVAVLSVLSPTFVAVVSVLSPTFVPPLRYAGRMRDDELRRVLMDANPWWAHPASVDDPLAWTASDRVLQDRATYDLGYRPAILEDIAAGPNGSLVVLTGPRRNVQRSVM